MKRELKFRVWDGERMIFLSDLSIGLKKSKKISPYAYFATDTFGSHVKLGHHELMQFTGLLDKNGKEIYEGDIVEVFCTDETSTQCGQSQGLHEVRFEFGFFGIMWKVEMSLKDVCSPLYIELNKDVFIRGNIYEHKNLLK
jgi:uncharacterized phage protein (TIGR01671 family)